MATNSQIEQSFRALQESLRTLVLPAINQLRIMVDNGATIEQIRDELTRVQSLVDNLYTQIRELIELAKQNTPVPDILSSLETAYNVERLNVLAILKTIATDATNNATTTQVQTDAITRSRAQRDQGPNLASAGIVVAAASLAKTFLTQNPPTPASSILSVPNSVTNAISTALTIPVGLPVTPKIPGAQALTTINGPVEGELSTVFVSASASPGTFGLEPDTADKTVEQSFIYKMTSVVSKFSRGQFTQDLRGVIVTFDEVLALARATNTANTADLPPSETNRNTREEDSGRTTTGADGNPGGIDTAAASGAYSEYDGPATSGEASVNVSVALAAVGPAENNAAATSDGQVVEVSQNNLELQQSDNIATGTNQLIARDD
jgi:hypothetical protein